MQWTYITGVKNGKAQYLYVNGELVDSTIDAIPSTKQRVMSFDVAIGKVNENDADKGDWFFNGIIDEVRIHSVSLSSDWVRLCYMNQRNDDKLVIVKLD